jgi:uncharacterized protein
MRKTRDQVLRVLGSNREKIRGFGVRRIGLFGSTVRNEASGSSDLDFVVELEKKSFDQYMDLKIYLEGLFGCKVDVVLADAIKPRLRASIMQEVVYAPGL